MAVFYSNITNVMCVNTLDDPEAHDRYEYVSMWVCEYVREYVSMCVST